MFFQILFSLMFLAVLIVFFVILGRNIVQWRKNNQSPRLTVDATVVAKRSNTSVSHTPVAGDASGAHGFTSTSSTSYHVTFQVESGDRMEFTVLAHEYGMLAEGDRGRLTFQGTRYLGFERTASIF